ncbi:hypothetical protein K9N08_04220 [Candidatus Gracilibacteria bacterium]|nr:hypothetical protein [Candidatus Gracilibacteria bacterium]MCF7856719.1 hypothetical protein [Candidatus Gracilibacteria bacterium]MCF7897030.1 hypothetical protein [Candidatus Gracilibacteria bacterium]
MKLFDKQREQDPVVEQAADKKATELFEEAKPELLDALSSFFASLGGDDINESVVRNRLYKWFAWLGSKTGKTECEGIAQREVYVFGDEYDLFDCESVIDSLDNQENRRQFLASLIRIFSGEGRKNYRFLPPKNLKKANNPEVLEVHRNGDFICAIGIQECGPNSIKPILNKIGLSG